ncbi:PD-(D/E)XK nuclease superfamily protein, partial [Ruminobacter amylophilus]
LLIDEYDVPIAKAAHYDYYDEMIDIISPFLGNALKTNLYLGRAVLTGCLRAAKESIFTGLNNLKICSVLDTGKDDISQGIGFTEKETGEVLSYYGLTDHYESVRNNYDGYYFGKNHMYCPWDVMSFCDDNHEKLDEDRNLISADNYWINTSGNDVIEEFMGFIRSEDVDKMQDLLDGKSITTEVRTSLCYGDLKNHNVNDFWTLLLYTGYLTFDPQYRSDTKNEYRLYIPNEEIKDCFKSKIMDFFKTNPEMRNSTGDLVKGLFEGNAEEVETKLNALLMKYVSIRDFATNAPKENYYHGFINGLLASGTSYMEEHKSNTESGDGYADIIAASKSSDSVAVLELKQTDRPFGARVVSAGRALEQILEKRYADVFIDDPSVKNIYAYGICFYKKICSVQVKKLK